MPQDEAKRVQEALQPIKIRRQKPAQEAPKERPMSFEGFGENLLRNAYDIAKGLVNVFPAAIKSGAEVFGDPEGMKMLVDNPEHLVKAFRDTGAALGHAMIDPYQKHGLRVGYEEPLTPLLDAMTIITLGGGAIAKTGRLAGSAKLTEAGAKISAIPERIAAGMLKAPLKAVGINPETRQWWLRNRRQEKSGARLEAAVRKDRITGPAVKATDEDLVAMERIVLDGGKGADLANPKVAALYNDLRDWIKKERENELLETGRNLLTDEQALNRVIGEYAERNAVDLAEARRRIVNTPDKGGLEVKPLYLPVVREGMDDFVNAFSPSVIKKGQVSYLEKWSTSLGATKDVRKRINRAIDDFYDSRANLR